MSETGAGGPGRHANGRFGPGNPGRPLGSGNRRARQVASALLADFEANQEELLEKLRRYYFSDYLRLIGRLLPRPAVDDGRDEPQDILDAAAMAAEVGAVLARLAPGEPATDLTVKNTGPSSAHAAAGAAEVGVLQERPAAGELAQITDLTVKFTAPGPGARAGGGADVW